MAPSCLVGRVPLSQNIDVFLILHNTLANLDLVPEEVSVSSGVLLNFLCFCPFSSGELASSCHWSKKEEPCGSDLDPDLVWIQAWLSTACC